MDWDKLRLTTILSAICSTNQTTKKDSGSSTVVAEMIIADKVIPTKTFGKLNSTMRNTASAHLSQD